MTRFIALLFALMPLSAVAHPHIFIDTGFELIADDQGQFSHIRVTWVYDEYYSLLIIEDLKIDSDYDGILTTQDQTRLIGFDANWEEGFNGDLVITLNGAPLALSGPLQPTATFDNGRITTTHLRKISGAPNLSGHVLSLKPYDATYYSAYDVTLPVTITGWTGCLIEKIVPDSDGALSGLRDQLARLGPDEDPNANQMSQIGGELSTEVRVSCPAS